MGDPQWQPGQSGNPKGRPRDPKTVRYHQILMTRCTLKDWKAIVDKAIEQAKDGNAAARRWLSGYVIGSPRQQVELTGPDGTPVQVDVGFASALEFIYGDKPDEPVTC